MELSRELFLKSKLLGVVFLLAANLLVSLPLNCTLRCLEMLFPSRDSFSWEVDSSRRTDDDPEGGILTLLPVLVFFLTSFRLCL